MIAPMIQRPHYSMMTVADALTRDWRGWSLSRKMDGCFEWRGNTCGERMPGGTFHPFDIAAAGDWCDRSAALLSALQSGWQPVQQGQGEAFIREMIEAARRDGTPDVVVAKPLGAPFGVSLTKIKLVETFDMTVTDTGDGRLSIGLSYQGSAAGRCPVRDLAILDSLRVGEVVEVAGTLTVQGKIREPRFLRARPDKGVTP